LITSQYILDIFDLSFDNHSESDLLRKQISFLTVADIDHTGIGAFIHFSADEQIQQYRLDISNATNFDIEGNATSMVDGVEIKNPDLSILADAIIWLKNGLIDHLEIFNKSGEKYVLTDPEHYQLDQAWLDNNKRRSIIR
jgi:hypothetical protein